MGNSPTVDQGSPAGAHDRDVRSSDSEKRHDWSKEQLATAKPEEQSPQEKLQLYSGAQRAAPEKRDLTDRKKIRRIMPTCAEVVLLMTS